MTGLGKLPDKDKRLMRIRNHIAKDLGSNKYRQRITPKPPVDPPEIDDFDYDTIYEHEDLTWIFDGEDE